MRSFMLALSAASLTVPASAKSSCPSRLKSVQAPVLCQKAGATVFQSASGASPSARASRVVGAKGDAVLRLPEARRSKSPSRSTSANAIMP